MSKRNSSDTMREEIRQAATMLTRRAFIGALAFGAAAMGAAARVRGGIVSSLAVMPGAATVSFHMDQPYLDTTGRGMPYHPPNGARGAAPMANFSETAFRGTHHYDAA